ERVLSSDMESERTSGRHPRERRDRSRDRRDRRPATPPGVEARFARGRWTFRARRVVGGRPKIGSWHEDVAVAAADRARLEQHAGALRAAAGLSLADALEQLVGEAEARGVSPTTIRSTYKSHGRFLVRRLGGDTELAALASDPDR